MTIKNRLILSHVLVFIVPLVMTAVLFLVALGGIWLFTHSGNPIYVESRTQFNRTAEGLHHIVFRTLQEEGDDPQNYRWVVEPLSPAQNYIVLTKNGTPIYQYGDPSVGQSMTDFPKAKQPLEAPNREQLTYTQTEEGRYYYAERRFIGDDEYHFYYFCREIPHEDNEVVEHAIQWTLLAIFLASLILLGGTIYLLTRFVLRYIMNALHKLRHGADCISSGDLNVYITYDNEDEVKPVVDTFNIMTRELRTSLQERARQEKNRKELIASLSHDIRTPLTAIRAYVEGLSDNIANTPEKRRHYIDVIETKAEDMNRMIDQLFLFSKIDLGEQALPMARLNAPHLVQQIVSENDGLWKDKAVITIDSSEDVFIQGNPELWSRIMTNLITKSIKYKTKDVVSISISIKKTQSDAVITVCDDGPGVAPEALSRLTEPFFRTDKARSHTGNGSGLGLSIVARGVSLMKGTVHFSLAEPSGLCVHITMPLEEDSHE